MINTTFSLTEMQHFVRAAVAVSSSMVGFKSFPELYVFNAACKVMRQSGPSSMGTVAQITLQVYVILTQWEKCRGRGCLETPGSLNVCLK